MRLFEFVSKNIVEPLGQIVTAPVREMLGSVLGNVIGKGVAGIANEVPLADQGRALEELKKYHKEIEKESCLIAFLHCNNCFRNNSDR